MSDLKVKDLRYESEYNLASQLHDLRENLLSLRSKQQGARPGEIKRVRKSIARVLTVINIKARTKAAEATKNDKFIPKDLRPKLTRALRRKLTPAQAQAKTLRAQKKAAAFPKRKYALKA